MCLKEFICSRVGKLVVPVFGLIMSMSGAHATTIATLDADGKCTKAGMGPEYRNHDGSCNNTSQGTWGSAGSKLVRLGPTSYADNMSAPRLSVVVDAADMSLPLPSTREISNKVVAQSGSIPNTNRASDMLMQWGQFLDHDIDLTPTHDLMDSPDESMPISIPTPSDRFWSIYHDGGMPFTRSEYAGETGISIPESDVTTVEIPREQVNAITAYIDASQIYGSDGITARSLRDPDGVGRLLMTGDLLHMVDHEFVSGDERAREQVGLTAMHTLFNREHNRLAGEIETTLRQATHIDGIPKNSSDPDVQKKYAVALDEKVYQEARKLVGAMMQSITFNEFLPALLGSGAPGAYGGYDDTVNPGIANEFSTAAYRFGHSTLSDTMLRLGADGQPISAGSLALADAFFNPEHLLTVQFGGIEAVLRGLASQRGQEVDPFLVDGVRNLLFGPMGFDLAALNMQRGRDHGLPSYTAMRHAMFKDDAGIMNIDDWDDLDGIMMAGAVDLLDDIYDHVDDIDLWIGGLAENHVDGGMLGKLFSAIIRGQFNRLRAGDRFWYQNDNMFEPTWMEFVERSTLSAIMTRNGISGLQANVFFVPVPATFLLIAMGLLLMRGRAHQA